MKFELKVLSNILFKKIDNLIEKNELQGKKIILFGLNITSYSMKNYLEQKGFKVYAYIDNNKKKVQNIQNMCNKTMPRHLTQDTLNYIADSKVISAYLPKELLEQYQENIVVLIASKFYKSMCQQLKDMGYKEGENIVQVVDFYSIDTIIKSEENIEQEGQEIDEIRPIQLQILNYVKDVCEKNRLRYYLCGGTLLGAVRHKGYIPWDDDIDLLMPLKDYNELIEVLKKDNRYIPFDICNQPESCYKFYLRIVDNQTYLKSWEYPFLTTSSVSIDIFPLTGVPSDAKERYEFINEIAEKKANYLSTFIEYCNMDDRVFEERKKLREDIITMIACYDFDNSEVVGNPVSNVRELETVPKSIFDESIDLEFEGELFKAPKGYDIYLCNVYGNYMELPPIEERTTTHNYRVYKE